MPSVVAYLGLGSNLGDRLSYLRMAAECLAGSGRCQVLRVSSLYATKPVGVEHQPEFLNAVIAVKTDHSPAQLLSICQRIEGMLGRTRTFRWGPRVIDIDILLYDEERIRTDDLVIPHPRLAERGFVLVPLAEIAPSVNIGTGETAARAAKRVGDEGLRRVKDSSWFS